MNQTTAAREILAQALNTTVDKLGPDPRAGVTEGWESLAHLRLVLALEERLGRQLAPDQVFDLVSLTDISDLLDG